MEENRRPQPPGNAGCGPELTPTNSDATSSLALQNCEGILCSSENCMPDDGSEWTNEKHNLYLHQLEESFVKQLHQSKSMLARCSEQSQSGMHISQKKLINTNKACEEVKFNIVWNGYWKKINYARVGKIAATSLLKSSHNKPSSDSLLGSTAEGTGQNFSDEDIETSLNFESLPKRQKRVCEDISIQRSN